MRILRNILLSCKFIVPQSVKRVGKVFSISADFSGVLENQTMKLIVVLAIFVAEINGKKQLYDVNVM